MEDLIRIIIVDDHTLFRNGLVSLLNSLPGLKVIAAVENGHQAIKSANDLQPDVILMDIQMEGINGIEATRQIVQTSPHIGVIVVTMFDDDDSVFSAMRAGARGYILKGADQEDVLRAIHTVAKGEAIFGPSIATRLMNFFNQPNKPVSPAFPDLTDREREVLDLIAQGLTNSDISSKLFISIKTVRNHVSNIFNKLQVSDRVQAAIRAREAGLGNLT